MKPDGSTRRTRPLRAFAAAPLLDKHRHRQETRAPHRSRAGPTRFRDCRDRQSPGAARRRARPRRSPGDVSAPRRRSGATIVDGPAARTRRTAAGRARAAAHTPRRATVNSAARTASSATLQRRSGPLRARHPRSRRRSASFSSRRSAIAPGSSAAARASRSAVRLPHGRTRSIDGSIQLRLRPRIDQRRSRRRQPGERRSCREPRDRPVRARFAATRPMTGADTTNRSRTRVSPSSSIVTCIGPRTDCGHVDVNGTRPQRHREDRRRRTATAAISRQDS